MKIKVNQKTVTTFQIVKTDNDKKTKKPVVSSIEIVCPRCGYDQCFFNGVCYDCPDCGLEWDCIKF